MVNMLKNFKLCPTQQAPHDIKSPPHSKALRVNLSRYYRNGGGVGDMEMRGGGVSTPKEV